MKKKHRDITVNGVKYGWKSGVYYDATNGTYHQLTVWKNRKVWFTTRFDDTNSIKPKMVATEIEKHLDK